MSHNLNTLLFSRVRLFCNAMDCSSQSPLSMGFKQEYWIGWQFSLLQSVFPNPGSNLYSTLQVDPLPLSYQGSPSINVFPANLSLEIKSQPTFPSLPVTTDSDLGQLTLIRISPLWQLPGFPGYCLQIWREWMSQQVSSWSPETREEENKFFLYSL